MLMRYTILLSCAAGADFVPKGTVDIVFQPTDNVSCAPVIIIDDTSQERNEVFETIFTIPGSSIAMPMMLRLVANITIIDDDIPSKSARGG